MSIQRIRTSIALLKSIIDKSAELHGEHADPVIVIVDTNEVIHYEIYPLDQPSDVPVMPVINSLQSKSSQ